MQIPTLETARLELRGHRRSDHADCTALWADPIVTKHISGRAFTAEETWARLLRNVGHWHTMGFGYWVVCERSTQRFVGEVGFADLMREMSPSIAGTPEAGWVLMPWAHGRGFATEAMTRATEWIEAELHPARTVCLIAPENEASLRVAAKCGYREQLRTKYKEQPTILLER